jgi:hypothetical protein
MLPTHKSYAAPASASSLNPPASRVGRVALIAVHGVGSPEPGSTARAIADLLLTGSPTPFTERPLRISEAMPASLIAHAKQLLTPRPRDDRRFRVRGLLDPMITRRPAGDDTWSLDRAVSAAHVADYEIPPHARTYATVVVEGVDPTTGVPVDIYELHWADLSKSEPSVLGAVKKLSSFPHHFLGIARRTVQYAGLDGVGRRRWDVVALGLYLLRFLLIILMPVLNATYLTAATCRIPTLVHGQTAIAALLPGVAVFCTLARAGYRKNAAGLRHTLVVPLMAAAVVAGSTFVGLEAGRQVLPLLTRDVLAIEWILAVYVGGWILTAQAELRAHLRATASAVTAATCVAYCVYRAEGAFAGQWEEPVVGTCGVLLAVLAMTWLATLAATLALLTFALLPPYAKAGDLAARARARLATRTWCMASAGTVLGVLVVQTLFLQASTSKWFLTLAAIPDAKHHIPAWGDRFLRTFALGIPLAGGAFLVFATLVLLYVLAPSIGWEITGATPSPDDSEPPATTPETSPKAHRRAEQARSPGESRRLGNWLTRGWRLTGFLVPFYVGSSVALPLGISAFIARGPRGWVGNLGVLSNHGWQAASALTVALVAWLVRSPASIRSLWPIIGIVFDIDAYLSERPEHATPRARMMERFASLLKCIRRQSAERGYDRVVVVAHSQGTVVVADALRLFAGVEDPDIRPSGIELVTMGCPLGAIYATYFPHLYEWVPRARGIGGTEDEVGPDPLGLGVARWRNLYRSGDYIGRNLWPWAAPDSPFDIRANRSGNDHWQEQCLGAGAHMGYWRDPSVRGVLREILRASTATGVPCAGAFVGVGVGATYSRWASAPSPLFGPCLRGRRSVRPQPLHHRHPVNQHQLRLPPHREHRVRHSRRGRSLERFRDRPRALVETMPGR